MVLYNRDHFCIIVDIIREMLDFEDFLWFTNGSIHRYTRLYIFAVLAKQNKCNRL